MGSEQRQGVPPAGRAGQAESGSSEGWHLDKILKEYIALLELKSLIPSRDLFHDGMAVTNFQELFYTHKGSRGVDLKTAIFQSLSG